MPVTVVWSRSRRRFLGEIAGTGAFVMPVHFPHPTKPAKRSGTHHRKPFWVEARELYQNRGESQAGNQVDTPRGTSGTAPVAKGRLLMRRSQFGGDSNHVILSVELRSPRR